MTDICFDKGTFNMYLFLLVCVIIFLFYTYRENFSNINLNSDLAKNQLLIKITELQGELFNSKLNNQQFKSDLLQQKNNTQDRFLEKIYNPLKSPEQIYQNGNFYDKGYNGYTENQMMGFITNSNGQYPIMGKYHYPGKTDKFDYYTINEGRNKIKIPIKTKNYNELYDGDSVNVPELGGDFIFKKYDNEEFKYDPNKL